MSKPRRSPRLQASTTTSSRKRKHDEVAAKEDQVKEEEEEEVVITAKGSQKKKGKEKLTATAAQRDEDDEFLAFLAEEGLPPKPPQLDLGDYELDDDGILNDTFLVETQQVLFKDSKTMRDKQKRKRTTKMQRLYSLDNLLAEARKSATKEEEEEEEEEEEREEEEEEEGGDRSAINETMEEAEQEFNKAYRKLGDDYEKTIVPMSLFPDWSPTRISSPEFRTPFLDLTPIEKILAAVQAKKVINATLASGDVAALLIHQREPYPSSVIDWLFFTVAFSVHKPIAWAAFQALGSCIRDTQKETIIHLPLASLSAENNQMQENGNGGPSHQPILTMQHFTRAWTDYGALNENFPSSSSTSSSLSCSSSSSCSSCSCSSSSRTVLDLDSSPEISPRKQEYKRAAPKKFPTFNFDLTMQCLLHTLQYRPKSFATSELECLLKWTCKCLFDPALHWHTTTVHSVLSFLIAALFAQKTLNSTSSSSPETEIDNRVLYICELLRDPSITRDHQNHLTILRALPQHPSSSITTTRSEGPGAAGWKQLRVTFALDLFYCHHPRGSDYFADESIRNTEILYPTIENFARVVLEINIGAYTDYSRLTSLLAFLETALSEERPFLRRPRAVQTLVRSLEKLNAQIRESQGFNLMVTKAKDMLVLAQAKLNLILRSLSHKEKQQTTLTKLFGAASPSPSPSSSTAKKE
ncbi:putative B-box zinc finger protein [Balamuthia mandrillaris]